MNQRAAIYLNHAGTSWPKPAPVLQAVAKAYQADPADWPSKFEWAHRLIAEFFSMDDPSRLLLTPGCTSALNVAVADLSWKESDRAITSGLEHHALHRPLTKLAERGVELTVVGRADTEPLDLESLQLELKKGGVRLVALTAACNVTGDLLPIKQAIDLAHRYGALALIDGAQIAGWWDLDVPGLGADLFAFAGHKGLQAPWGIGGLYVAEHVVMRSPVATCDVGEANAPACSLMPGYCDVGSVDRAALAGLAAATDWLSAPSQRDRLTTARSHTARLADALSTYNRLKVLGCRDSSQRMPTVAVTVGDADASLLAAHLADRGVIASAGLQCALLAHASLGTSPQGALRFSAGPMTTTSDVDHAIDAIHNVFSAID